MTPKKNAKPMAVSQQAIKKPTTQEKLRYLLSNDEVAESCLNELLKNRRIAPATATKWRAEQKEVRAIQRELHDQHCGFLNLHISQEVAGEPTVETTRVEILGLLLQVIRAMRARGFTGVDTIKERLAPQIESLTKALHGLLEMEEAESRANELGAPLQLILERDSKSTDDEVDEEDEEEPGEDEAERADGAPSQPPLEGKATQPKTPTEAA